MGKETWRAIRENKSFTIRMYRRGSLALLISLGLNLVFIMFAFLAFLREAEPEYYASDGIRLPILLDALDKPNMTSTYLLAPDPLEEENNARVIPE